MEYTLTFTKPDGRAESVQINTTEKGSTESLFWVFKTIDERLATIKKNKETITITLNNEPTDFPSNGVLFSKDLMKRLDYNKINGNYEFCVFEGKVKKCGNYVKIKYKKTNNECIEMIFNQFVNYLYTEGYIDEKPKQKHK
jgi:hypothetical protein